MAQRKSETHEEYNARVRVYQRQKRASPEYQQTGRIAHNAYANTYYHTHSVAIRARRQELHQLHYEEDLAKKRKYGLTWRQKIRFETLIAYSGNPPKCACCSETIPEFLGIDHINRGGNKHFDLQYGGKKRLGGVGLYRWLKAHNFPPGYQVLCHNCNLAKGFYGICPHQKSLATSPLKPVISSHH